MDTLTHLNLDIFNQALDIYCDLDHTSVSKPSTPDLTPNYSGPTLKQVGACQRQGTPLEASQHLGEVPVIVLDSGDDSDGPSSFDSEYSEGFVSESDSDSECHFIDISLACPAPEKQHELEVFYDSVFIVSPSPPPSPPLVSASARPSFTCPVVFPKSGPARVVLPREFHRRLRFYFHFRSRRQPPAAMRPKQRGAKSKLGKTVRTQEDFEREFREEECVAVRGRGRSLSTNVFLFKDWF